MKKRMYVLVLDGKKVDRGSARELAQKYDSSEETIRKCYKERRNFKKIYKIILNGYITNKSFQYYAYRDNEVIYKGTKLDLALALKRSKNDIEDACKYNTKINDYSIIRKLIDADDLVRLKVFKQRDYVNKKEQKLEYLKYHLTEYGNTVLGYYKENVIKDYIKKLKNIGVNAYYELIEDEDGSKWYKLTRKRNEEC